AAAQTRGESKDVLAARAIKRGIRRRNDATCGFVSAGSAGLPRLCCVSMDEISCVLSAIDNGDPQASEKLLPLVHDDPRRLAAARMAQQKPGQTLDPTAVVHEVYLRLVGSRNSTPDTPWDGRGHFFAAAAEAMRRILVESARRKRRLKHGG